MKLARIGSTGPAWAPDDISGTGAACSPAGSYRPSGPRGYRRQTENALATSQTDLSARMGHDLSPHRWRGNLWLDGAAPWAEWDWLGRDIRIGSAVLRVQERITRCMATTVEPATGHSNADTLGALEAAFGHQDFGLYATVVQDGDIALGDGWSIA